MAVYDFESVLNSTFGFGLLSQSPDSGPSAISMDSSSGAKVLKLSKKIITTFYALYRLNKREIVVRIGLFLYLYPPK